MRHKKHGKHISIDWDGCTVDYEFIRGHVTLDEAREELKGATGDEAFAVEHLWARFVPAPKNSDYRVMFHTQLKPGRGAFPVTEVQVVEVKKYGC